MTNSIQELKKMILNDDIKLSVILQHALVVASEYDENFIPWIKQEMNGYEFEKDCPEYRKAYGSPKAMNEQGIWELYICKNNKEQIAISRRSVRDSAPGLENYVKSSIASNLAPLLLIYSSESQEKYGIEGAKQFALHVEPHSIISILNKTRNKLLDWVINLSAKGEHISNTVSSDIIFPQELISRLPKDLKILTDDFNFNFSNDRTYACMLILRRMLPLSIVRKFQQDNNEKILKIGSDYLDTKALLAKAESLIPSRLLNDIHKHKILLDSSQHSYAFDIATTDVKGVAIILRMLLDEFFPQNNKNQ